MMLYISIKFRGYILNGFQFIQYTVETKLLLSNLKGE